MKDYCRYVNVFQGCDETDLPEPKGLAASWRLIKGLCGNCTPAAALPFGRITAGCYSGGYSSGYGRLMLNCSGPIQKLHPRNQFRGISHLQNDGTGDIETFYNYAVVSPFSGSLAQSSLPRDFSDEKAYPGYYACRDSMTGAFCEVTVTERIAIHRITFPGKQGKISIDFSNDGLYNDGGHVHSPAGKAHLELNEGNQVAACVELHHLPIYFHVKMMKSMGTIRLWADDKVIDGNVLDLPEGHRFGVLIEGADEYTFFLGLSPKDAHTVRRDVNTECGSFECAVEYAQKKWNSVLSRIDARFDNERDREIFYSNFYHTLLKPCNFSGESFLYPEEDFMLEFATIWDQYKTAFPLIYSLYPEIGSKIVMTMLNTFHATGKMPHTLMMCGGYDGSTSTQARMLAEYSIVDAYFRGVPFDAKAAMQAMVQDTFGPNRLDEYARKEEEAKHKAFIIDITDACAACAVMARELGEVENAKRFEKVAALWENVFDRETGLLKNSEHFYEGTRWNYSFRLMHDMDARIALAGGKEKFTGLADRFFGFTHPEDDTSCCFEGFNNETDMESPYVYHFVERHDRLSEVITDGMNFMFTTGRGGLPGNNDSGGLSSCYLWNALGFFPVSGQDLMIIGTPRVREATLTLFNEKTFTIRKEGEGIYVKTALLNGKKLSELCFSVRDMMRGGELVLEMK